jgi:hypothetical protein
MEYRFLIEYRVRISSRDGSIVRSVTVPRNTMAESDMKVRAFVPTAATHVHAYPDMPKNGSESIVETRIT